MLKTILYTALAVTLSACGGGGAPEFEPSAGPGTEPLFNEPVLITSPDEMSRFFTSSEVYSSDNAQVNSWICEVNSVRRSLWLGDGGVGVELFFSGGFDNETGPAPIKGKQDLSWGIDSDLSFTVANDNLSVKVEGISADQYYAETEGDKLYTRFFHGIDTDGRNWDCMTKCSFGNEGCEYLTPFE